MGTVREPGQSFFDRLRTNQSIRSPVAIGVSSINALNSSPVYQAAQAASRQTGQPLNNAALDRAAQALHRVNTSAAANTRPRTPTAPITPTSSGRRGGGGGGGGGGAPTMSQEQLDWAMSLLGAARPDAVNANTLDLPDYQGMATRAFDPSGFDQMRQQWAGAVGSDKAAAEQAYGQLGNSLTSNYRNAFQQNAPTTQGPGMDQATMARMLQSQGGNPALNAANVQGQAAGNAAFSNLWQLLGANEDTAQGNRMRRLGIDQNNTMRLLDLAGQSGNMQLNQQQGQALSAWQQRADERAYQDYQMQQQIAQQEAMQNWQRGNQVQDTNAGNVNSYNNSALQTLFGLLPQLAGTGLSLPTAESLGL